MQGRLRVLEEKLVTAQQHSEDAVTKHEEEIRDLRAAHNVALERIKNEVRTPKRFSSRASNTPFSPRAPRISRTSSGNAMSVAEATKTDFLEKRVRDLEKALMDADAEMEEVVSRMNMAQIEVMELQSERDEAIKVSKKLQADIAKEKRLLIWP
jgi:hypothetical protein